jgi:cytosine/adenosine deaminase-related metal-dependent hydrolase
MHRLEKSPYFRALNTRIQDLGGFFNAHLHLDRAGTLDETLDLLTALAVRDGASLSIADKHALIPTIHASSLYRPDMLEERVSGYLDHMVALGTRRADTVVDVTNDCVRLTAFDRMLSLKARYSDRLDLRVGAYTPLGFRDDQPERWTLFAEAAERADFVGLLPERDDRLRYAEHIGFEDCCRRALLLAARLGKPIHIHVDQANFSCEGGGETVVRLVADLGLGRLLEQEPLVWLIHLISPSTYDEDRFAQLATSMASLGVGLICCPSAAISMRQFRPVASPTSNSIARVLELLAQGVHVRLGSDNICDVTSPMGTPDMADELLVLGNALRFYDIDILARLACGLPMTDANLEWIRTHIVEDKAAIVAELQHFAHATDDG